MPVLCKFAFKFMGVEVVHPCFHVETIEKQK